MTEENNLSAKDAAAITTNGEQIPNGAGSPMQDVNAAAGVSASGVQVQTGATAAPADTAITDPKPAPADAAATAPSTTPVPVSVGTVISGASASTPTASPELQHDLVHEILAKGMRAVGKAEAFTSEELHDLVRFVVKEFNKVA